MADPYIGIIYTTAINFNPRGWAFCNGQLMSIAQNNALFAILGTTFGGDGQTTFGLPDLKGRIAVGAGSNGPGVSNYVVGQQTGTENVTLVSNQMPIHNHVMTKGTLSLKAVSNAGSTTVPTGNYLAASRAATSAGYSAAAVAPAVITEMNAASLPFSATNTVIAGGSQPFSILQPTLAMYYIIALEGIFPSRN